MPDRQKDNTSLSEILVYTPSFQLQNSFGRGYPTLGIALSENGRFVAIADATANGTAVDILPVGSDRTGVSLAFEGFPYFIGFTSSSTLSLVCDTALYTFRVDGELTEKVGFGGESLKNVAVSNGGVAILTEIDAALGLSRLIVVNEKGRMLVSKELTERVFDIALCDDTVFLLEEGRLIRISASSKEVLSLHEIANGAVAVSALDPRAAQIFYEAQAVTVFAKE
jgi:hypothetical protein